MREEKQHNIHIYEMYFLNKISKISYLFLIP